MPVKFTETFKALNTAGLFADEEDFKTQLYSDPKGVFNAVNQDKLFVDYSDFESQLGIKKKDGGSSSVSPSPLPSSASPQSISDFFTQYKKAKNDAFVAEQMNQSSPGLVPQDQYTSVVGSRDQLMKQSKESGYRNDVFDDFSGVNTFSFTDDQWRGLFNDKEAKPTSYNTFLSAAKWQDGVRSSIQQSNLPEQEKQNRISLFGTNVGYGTTSKSFEETLKHGEQQYRFIVDNVTDPKLKEEVLLNFEKDLSVGLASSILRSPLVAQWQKEGRSLPQELGKAIDIVMGRVDKVKNFEKTSTLKFTDPFAIQGRDRIALEYENKGLGALNMAVKEKGEVAPSEGLSSWSDYVSKMKSSQVNRYPGMVDDMVAAATQEWDGSNLGPVGKLVMNAGNVFRGINDLASSVYNNLFLTKDKALEQEFATAEINRQQDLMTIYDTQEQQLFQGPAVYDFSAVRDRLTAIDRSGKTEEEKRREKSDVIREGVKNGTISLVANPNEGKANIKSTSIINTISTVSGQLIGQLLLGGATGGFGTASRVKQSANLFTTTFLSSWSQNYQQAILDNNPNPSQYAMSHTIVDAVSEMFGNNLEYAQKIFKKGYAGQFFKNMTQGDWDAMIAKKTGVFSNIKRQMPEAFVEASKEGLIEEGVAQIGHNYVDDKPFMDNVASTGISATIGTVPFYLLGLPVSARRTSLLQKNFLYYAGSNSDVVVSSINEEVRAGDITAQEGKRRVDVVKTMSDVIKKMPVVDVNGRPLSDDSKSQLAFNLYLKTRAEATDTYIPEAQGEEIKTMVSGIEQENASILNGEQIKQTPYATKESTQQGQPAEGGTGQPQGVGQGQQEGGQGTGIQGQAPITVTNAGDSNIGGQGGVAVVTQNAAPFVSSLKTAAQDVETGATMNIDGTQYTGGGLVVPVTSMNTTSEELTPEMVAQFVDQNRGKISGNNFKVGIYKFPNSNKVSIDLNIVVPASSREAALKFTKEADQESLFNLDTFENIKTGATGNNPATFTDSEFKRIAEELAAGKEVTVFKTRAKKELRKDLGEDPVTSANKLSEALKSTGVNVVQHNTTAEYNAAVTGIGGQEGTDGVFSGDDGVIHLNMERINEMEDEFARGEGVSGNRIVWHEGSHPVINIIRNTNKPLYDQVVAGLNQLEAENEGVAAAKRFAEGYAPESVEDEFVVETAASIADGTIDLNSIPESTLQKLFDLFNKIAEKLGIKGRLYVNDKVAAKRVLGQIADALTTGKDISTVVGKENVKEFKANFTEVQDSLEPGGIVDAYIQPRLKDGVGPQASGWLKPEMIKSGEEMKKYTISSVVFYDNTKVGDIVLPNRVTGESVSAKGMGGFGYSYIDNIQSSNAVLAFVSIEKAIIAIKRAELYPDAIFGVAMQNPLTAHLGNVTTLNLLWGPGGMFEVSAKTKTADRDMVKAFRQSLVGLRDSRTKEEEVKALQKVVDRARSIKSVSDIYGVLAAEPFGTRNMIHSYMLQDKPSKVTASTREAHRLLHYKYGIPTKQEIADAVNDPHFKNATLGDIVKYVKPVSDKKIYTTSKEMFDLYSSKPTPEMVNGGYTIEMMPEDAAHESYPFVVKGENIGFGESYFGADEVFQEVKDKGVTKSLSFMPVGRRKADAPVGAIPQGAAEYGGPVLQASVGNRLAPNGKPSNLNDKQYQQVRTPEFKNWFGDWENDPENASKVVDPNGEPLVVYHGTDATFDEFLVEKQGSFTGGHAVGAFYFHPDIDFSEGKNKMAVFLNIRTPRITRFNPNPFEQQKAKGDKNDGIISLYPEGDFNEIAVFSPNQIKSATANVGRFSTTDNRIQESKGKRDLVSEAGKRRLMTEDEDGNYVFFHYSGKKLSKVDPSKFGANTRATGRDERPGIGISMYYTEPDMIETNVPDDYGYVVRIPKDQVYPFNEDPLNLLDEAEKEFRKKSDQAFDFNKQVAWVAKVAAARGYKMTVAEWNIGNKKALRAQTTEALKPELFRERDTRYSNVYKTKPEFQDMKSNRRKKLQESKRSDRDFKLAAFVVRKRQEGMSDVDLKATMTGMLPDVDAIIADPKAWLRTKYPSMSQLAFDNLFAQAENQNIYKPEVRNTSAGVIGGAVGDMIDNREIRRASRTENMKKIVTDFASKYLDPGRGMPGWVVALKDFATGSRDLEVQRAKSVVDKLRKEAGRIGFSDWALFSKALSSLSIAPSRTIPATGGVAMFDPYRAAGGRMFTTPDEMLPAVVPAEIAALPDEIRPFVYQMRGMIDRLTKDLVSSGYVTPEQAEVLEKNIGAYINRAYKMFSEKGYKPSKDAFDNAVRIMAKEKAVDIQAQNPTMSDEEVYKAAIEAAKRDVNDILNKKKNPFFKTGVDSRDTGVLKQRLDIPKHIRELMGEYVDPGIVFMMTIGKQASLRSASYHMSEMRRLGMGTLFFEGNDPNRPSSHSVEIASTGTESKSPLGGLYTTPEVAEALENVDHTYNDLTRAWMQIVGVVRWGKTVGSITTQFKNFESNLGFAVMNGLIYSGRNTKSFAGASKYVGGRMVGKDLNDITETVIRLGLVNSSVNAQELSAMLGSGDINEIAVDMALNPKSKWNKVKGFIGAPVEAANWTYRMGDDFWKVYAYLNERGQLADALYDTDYNSLTDEQKNIIDIESSERVKSTWPTYSRVIEAARYFSMRAPIFGNFISFNAEVMRILPNTIKIGLADIKSDNPKIRAMGMRRIGGVVSYAAFRTAVISAMGSLVGVGMSGVIGMFTNDDDEERRRRAVRTATPPFMRTGDLMIIKGDKPHEFTVVNASSIDPYGVLSSSLNAFSEGREWMYGKTMDPGSGAAVAELLGVFLEPEMTFETVFSAMLNTNIRTGEKIVLANDPDWVSKVSGYVWKNLEPSTVSLYKRLRDKGDYKTEALAIAGVRPYSINLHESFGFILSNAGKELEELGRRYTKDVFKAKTAEEKNAIELEAENTKMIIINKLNEIYNDFVFIGADPKVLEEMVNKRSSIKMSGFDKNTKKGIIGGKVSQKDLFKQRK